MSEKGGELPAAASHQGGVRIGCLGRATAPLVLLAALLSSGLCALVLTLLQPILQSSGSGESVHPWAVWWIEHPVMGMLLGLPAIGLAVVATLAKKYRWIWILLASVALLAPLAVVLLSFLAAIAPLYQYQPL